MSRGAVERRRDLDCTAQRSVALPRLSSCTRRETGPRTSRPAPRRPSPSASLACGGGGLFGRNRSAGGRPPLPPEPPTPPGPPVRAADLQPAPALLITGPPNYTPDLKGSLS
ncbi:hypothetical protein JYU34_007875 [Plutella xylostella]|uniref:Uncharacterized protein n=1 Tax=Plutella xylostella TaxID=51655 RepID=A0ABQ7QRK4_PLUXY|nr:hypothetical protein JYU34_007875 [Plutella xylostella]